MSAYPPPPPNAKDAWRAQRDVLKAQRRAAKYQARMQREQWKMQRRAMRRRSIVGPLVIILLGILFLMAQAGRISWAHLVEWYGRWWPVVLIAAGIVLVLEWMVDHARQENGTLRSGRSLGPGVVLLLVLMAGLGISLRYSDLGWEWKDHWFGPGWTGLAEALGDEHDTDTTSQHAIAENATLLIENPRGAVTVNGTSTDGQIHLSLHKQVWSWQGSDAQTKEQQLEPEFSGDAGHLTLTIASVNGGQADLSLEVPATTAVTVDAGHGAVTLSGLRGNAELTAGHGDVDVNAMGGTVDTHMNNDDASLRAHNVEGALTVEGHCGDVTLSGMKGPVTLRGEFFGATHADALRSPFRMKTSRTQFELERIDGALDISSESDLEARDLVGPVVLKTRNRNITLERVQGSVDITNRNGDVNVTQTKPLNGVQVNNSHGSVTVGLAEGQGFQLNATVRHGDVENDFGLSETESHDTKSLVGTVNGGGPVVALTTTDGDITVQKSSVASLPDTPPAPPKPGSAPGEPAVPGSPAAPPPAPGTSGAARHGKAAQPEKPSAPAVPKAPAAVNF